MDYDGDTTFREVAGAEKVIGAPPPRREAVSYLRNYTTSIPVMKTIAEIEGILATHGATDIIKQYDGAGNVLALSFVVQTTFGRVAYRLPMEAQQVGQTIKNAKAKGILKGLSKSQASDINTARRVGWRIIKDWLDAQMSLVEIALVKVEQVFLPYAWDPVNERTFFQAIVESKGQQLQGMLMIEGKDGAGDRP